MKSAVAIRHVGFEDLGSFAPVLDRAGYSIQYQDVGTGGLHPDSASTADLLVVLGGPVGVYESEAYPFLKEEVALIARRLSADLPLLGICLGAQLIAQALGSAVYPSGGKEIGWGAVALTEAGSEGPLRHLSDTPLLHWHGDTFDLPRDCTLLASTAQCVNQAFSRGDSLLALQFHPEVTARSFESWLIGHASELAGAGISPAALRADAARYAQRLEVKGAAVFEEWLKRLS